MTLNFGMVAWFALYFGIGFVGTGLARQYALHKRLVDEPGERRSHEVATPRGGGIAIVVAMLVVICALIVRLPSQIVLLASAGLGLLLVAGVGWVDDHRPLSPWLRLMVHGLAALLLAAGAYLGGSPGPVALVAFAAALVLVNVWNFMDGIDGLAASQAVIVGIGLALVAQQALAIHLALALVAATCGFLPFNAPRARIFLGDVGSGALGYGLALLVVLACRTLEPVRWPVLLLPLSAFVIDASLTLLARMVRGERWWMAHVEHAYQHWAQRSGHMQVSTGYALWTLTAMAGMLALLRMGTAFMMATVLAWYLSGIVVWVWLRDRRRTLPDG